MSELPALGNVGRLSSTQPLSSNDRIDICRGLFAILVVAAHAVDISWTVHPGCADRYPWWLHGLLKYVVASGIHWVIGFFVISGYCIQLSVMRATEDDRFPLGRYLVARLSRILPLYYAALVFAIVVEMVIAPARPAFWYNGLDARTLVAQVFVVQNVVQTYGSFAPSWSITNEMFYYISYGFLVSLGLACGVRATWLGMSLCVAVAIVAEVLYFGFFRSPAICGTGLLFGLGTLWFLGALVAENQDFLRKSRPWKEASRSWPAWLACAIAMWFTQRVHLQFVFIVLGIAFALMLVRFVTAETPTTLAGEGKPTPAAIEMLGLSSYPMYLFHGPLMMLIGSGILRWGWFGDWRITWLILVLAGVSSGVILGYLAERPTMRWRAALLRKISSPYRPAKGGRITIGMIGARQ